MVGRAALAGVVLAAAVGPASAGVLIAFRSPSGNVGCIYSNGLGPSGVRCDIRIQQAHPKAGRPKGCLLDWGDSYQLARNGRAHGVCHGDTALDPKAKVIAYGTSFAQGGIVCRSSRLNFSCRNRSGHGFLLSRERQRTF